MRRPMTLAGNIVISNCQSTLNIMFESFSEMVPVKVLFVNNYLLLLKFRGSKTIVKNRQFFCNYSFL